MEEKLGFCFLDLLVWVCFGGCNVCVFLHFLLSSLFSPSLYGGGVLIWLRYFFNLIVYLKREEEGSDAGGVVWYIHPQFIHWESF